MKKKIGIISDTHNMLRDNALEILEDVDYIIHAGDIANEKVYQKIKYLKDTTFVRGNCDRDEYASEIPEDITFDLYGKKIYVIHDINQKAPKADEADIVIYGHSHIYNLEENGQLILNPGSAGPRRFGRPASMAILTIDTESGATDVEKIDLGKEARKKDSNEMRMVEGVYDLLQRGLSIPKICNALGLSKKFVSRIAQLYFTHPGIDLEGILNRFEIANK